VDLTINLIKYPFSGQKKLMRFWDVTKTHLGKLKKSKKLATQSGCKLMARMP
jgi:hypothetical protein